MGPNLPWCFQAFPQHMAETKDQHGVKTLRPSYLPVHFHDEDKFKPCFARRLKLSHGAIFVQRQAFLVSRWGWCVPKQCVCVCSSVYPLAIKKAMTKKTERNGGCVRREKHRSKRLVFQLAVELITRGYNMINFCSYHYDIIT